MMKNKLDIRQTLEDQSIRDLVSEINAETFKIINRCQRLIQTKNGPEWCYFVRADGRAVDERGNLLS